MKKLAKEAENKKSCGMEFEKEMRLEQEKLLVEEQKPRAQEMNEKKERSKVEEAILGAKEAKQRAREEGRLKFEQEKINEIKLVEQVENKKATERVLEVEEEVILEQEKRLVEEKMYLAQEEQHSIRVKPEEQRCLSEEEQHRIAGAEEERQDSVMEQQQFLIDILSKLSKGDIQLPQAIEKVLALKNGRAQLLGIDVDTAPTIDDKGPPPKSASVALVDIDDDVTFENVDSFIKCKESTNNHCKKKNLSSKFKAKTRAILETHNDLIDNIDVEYIQVIDVSDPLYLQYMKIFQLADDEKEKETKVDVGQDQIKEENINPMALRKKPEDLDDHEKDDDRTVEEKPKFSIRKFKKLSKMEVAKLRQKVSRPEAVAMHDVTAKDPVLLLHLKACNTVPAPCHWCSKHKYLQGKRKIKKPAFKLPDFMKRTGNTEMRQALQEKDQNTRRTKMRERVRPKSGEIDIDYQKLCDDIFQWNFKFKPKMIQVTPLEVNSADEAAM